MQSVTEHKSIDELTPDELLGSFFGFLYELDRKQLSKRNHESETTKNCDELQTVPQNT